MIDLLYLARDHDLPPNWDGHHIEWKGWQTIAMHICPPPKREPCRVCASMEDSVCNFGIIRDLNRKTGRRRRYCLLAMRCPDCRTDAVRDWSDTWWDLGPEDYTSDGSRVLR